LQFLAQGAHGLLAARSFDGGTSYGHDWAEFSSCSDKEPPLEEDEEQLPRATDPWVSFDAGGRAYQIGLSIIDGTLTRESALSTSTSDDGGLTWSGLGGATNKIVLSRSTDGGRHWSSPTIVSHHNSAQSFNHAVEVANDGELAVLYYDDAANDDETPGIPTDVYLRHSGDGGRTWSDPQLLTSFDFATTPIARGYFVRDYQGLAAIGPTGLLAFFGVTDATEESANVTSIRLHR